MSSGQNIRPRFVRFIAKAGGAPLLVNLDHIVKVEPITGGIRLHLGGGHEDVTSTLEQFLDLRTG